MELREYQKKSLSALWRWFQANAEGAPLLVLPTGAGKSIVIAEIAKKICERGPDRRVLILAHRKELLEQNYEKLSTMWPFGSIGLYSAGLNRRDTDSQVIVAGVQSVYRKASELGKFSLVIIDEVHLVPADGEGMYRTLIDGLKEENPGVRFCGLTATPYRLGDGLLTQAENGLFTAIAYDVGIRELIEQGFLSPLKAKAGRAKANLSLVSIRAGEYVQEEMERAFNRSDIVEAAVSEIAALGAGRKSWLVFAAGVDHAERVGETMRARGIAAGVVTGDTPPMMREQVIKDFKSGKMQALVNCDVLTTGFDHPGVDLIAVLRATKSTALWVQVCGRGARKAEGKDDCLILDFGENSLRHGPIDRIKINYRRDPLTGRDDSRIETPPVRICNECMTIVFMNLKECPDCGVMFPTTVRGTHHGSEASTAPILSTGEPAQEEPIDVDIFRTDYAKHQKKEKPLPTMRVDYCYGQMESVPLGKVSEWVCFEHGGYAGDKARKWWYERGGNLTLGAPVTVDEALSRLREVKNPKRLRIQKDGKFWRVLKVLEAGECAQPPDEPTEADNEAAEFFKTFRVNL